MLSGHLAFNIRILLVIRLQRVGRKNLAAYRVVVAEKHRAVKKKAIEVIGHYQPTRNPKVIEIDTDKVTDWISKGAKPSSSVASLLKKLGMKDMDQYLTAPNKKAKRKKASDDDEATEASQPAAE
jgi:small subunit ribosomal protein S16